MTSIGNTGSAVGVDTEYEKSLTAGIRDDASLHSEYDQTGSVLGNEFSKGLAANICNGVFNPDTMTRQRYAFRRTDVARIKQFLSLREDRFRAAYGCHVKEMPRFWGTTNSGDCRKYGGAGPMQQKQFYSQRRRAVLVSRATSRISLAIPDANYVRIEYNKHERSGCPCLTGSQHRV